ncbi:MAG TPA: oligosaccharide flippase family protein [Saprospiraceae bacterium]|nr:oligosaccharide flippase family protein [Saprospiraceae bacterium]
MTLLRKLAGETAIYGTSYILSRVLHFLLFTFYLTWVLAKDQFGIYRDLYFYVAMVLVLLTFRMETTFFRYAKEDKPAVTMMSLSFLGGVGGLFLLMLWLFRADVASWLKYDGMTTHIMLLGGVLFVDTLSAVPFASLRQQNRPWRFLALKLGAIVLNVVFVLFFLEVLPALAKSGGMWQRLLEAHDKLYYIFLSNLLASLMVFVLLLPLMRHQDLRWDFGFLKKMMAYSWPLVIVAIAGVINQSSAITFQKLILPNDLTTNLAEGGVYTAAASIAILLNLFTIAFNFAAEPFFFAHKEREDARQIYADVALVFTIVGSVMMLVILAYIDLVQLLLGKNFRSGLQVVPVLLLSYLLLGIYYNFSAWYKLTDKTLWGAWIAIGGAVITIVGNILLIPKWGVMGSAWAALACYVFMCITSYMQGQRHFPIPYKLVPIMGWMIGAIGFYLLMEWFRRLMGEHLVLNLLINTILVLAYGLLIYKFEKKMILQLVRKK